jgi:hypothetical protein
MDMLPQEFERVTQKSPVVTEILTKAITESRYFQRG